MCDDAPTESSGKRAASGSPRVAALAWSLTALTLLAAGPIVALMTANGKTSLANTFLTAAILPVFAVMGSLVARYFGLVIGAQTLTALVTGHRVAQQPLVLVRSTLLIAALFQSARRWLQRAMNRRFYRSRYDAAKPVVAFSATLRSEVDVSRRMAACSSLSRSRCVRRIERFGYAPRIPAGRASTKAPVRRSGHWRPSAAAAYRWHRRAHRPARSRAV